MDARDGLFTAVGTPKADLTFVTVPDAAGGMPGAPGVAVPGGGGDGGGAALGDAGGAFPGE